MGGYGINALEMHLKTWKGNGGINGMQIEASKLYCYKFCNHVSAVLEGK